MQKHQIIILIFWTLFIQSCSITKQNNASKDTSQQREVITTQTVRKGDTVRITVPQVKLKDTTIYRTNTVTGTTTVVRADNKGNVDIDCISAEINELRRELRELNQSKETETKETEHNANNAILLYFFVAIVLLGGIAIYLFYRTINSNTKAVVKVLERL